MAKHEKRGEERFTMVFSVYLSGTWGAAFGIARNISEGGMFIETPDPYPLGSKLHVTFYLPERDTEITALGEVVHLCFLDRTAAGAVRDVMVGVGIRFVEFLLEESRTSPAELAYAQ